MNNQQEDVQSLKVSVILPVTTDGPNSIVPIKASLPGESSPIALKIYRQWYDDHRDELPKKGEVYKKGGVYIQIGKKFEDEPGEEQEEREAVYVGKTNDFCRRFSDHDRQETGLCSWHTAIWFLMENSDESFRLAMERKLCDVIDPRLLSTKRASKDVDEECGRNFQRLLESMVALSTVLGHGEIFCAKDQGEDRGTRSNDTSSPRRLIFVCKSRDGANARGYETKDGKFIVMKGSRLSDGVAEEFRPLSYLNRRKEIEGDSKIVKNKCLIDSCEFRCSSEAAAVIRGRSSNGYDAWKTPDGKMTFGDFLRSKEIGDGKLQNGD